SSSVHVSIDAQTNGLRDPTAPCRHQARNNTNTAPPMHTARIVRAGQERPPGSSDVKESRLTYFQRRRMNAPCRPAEARPKLSSMSIYPDHTPTPCTAVVNRIC